MCNRQRTKEEYIQRHADQYCNGDAEEAKKHAIVKAVVECLECEGEDKYMERLTEYHNGVAVIKDKSKHKEAMERLAAYEETGLFPEDIYKIDEAYTQQAKELMEYKNAEEQGLLLRLPCKVGNSVYYVIEETVPNQYYYISEQKITNVSVRGIWFEEDMEEWENVGKAVFLTREEAEAKLEELRGKSNEQDK